MNMDATNLGTLGLVTATFAMPLLVLVIDDIHRSRHSRRPATRRVQAPGRTQFQAHPMGPTRRP